MPLSRVELLQQLENIRLEKNSGTMLTTTQNKRCASITLSDGEIVAATYGTLFGLEALKALTDTEFLSSTFKKNHMLRVPIAEISDPQQAHHLLEAHGFKFSPPVPAPAEPAGSGQVKPREPAPSAYQAPVTSAPVVINKAMLATIEAVANDVLKKPRGSEVFHEALSQLDDELEEADARQLLLVLMIDQIEDGQAAERFVK
jgi:hypothetical protein